MKSLLTTLTLAFLFITTIPVYSQPFINDIQSFKKQDSASFPPENAILFTGSSSFTKWTDVKSAFPGYSIINRGFGGSTLPDVIRYANDIIIPYNPKQVVIYCGDNDLASSDTVTATIVTERFKKLFYLLRKGLPKARITYVSIKPSPSRERLIPKVIEANVAIKKFLKEHKNTSFVDVYHPMLLPNGKPRPDLFVEDNLHMNEKGYKIWQKAIKPYLLKS